MQPSSPTPCLLKSLQIVRSLNTFYLFYYFFFPGDFTTSSLNLQSSLQGYPCKSTPWPGFVRSFRKKEKCILALTQSCPACDATIKHLHTIQCLIALFGCESPGNVMHFCTQLLLKVTRVSGHSFSPSLAISTVTTSSFLQMGSLCSSLLLELPQGLETPLNYYLLGCWGLSQKAAQHHTAVRSLPPQWSGERTEKSKTYKNPWVEIKEA